MKNTFNKKTIITVHDNILSDLYSLNINGTYKLIDNEEYLVNEIVGRNYKVGLRVKIPCNLLTINGVKKRYSDLTIIEQEEIFNKLKDKLFFTNIEILFSNILLDKFLKNHQEFSISFEEIEKYYRKKLYSNKVKISDLNYKRYIATINSLAEKEIYLETAPKFREPKYGVNNLYIKQPFLIILKKFHYKENNIVFSYSFGEFGKAIKLSRRYSTYLASRFYALRLNQSMKHTLGFFLAQQIFIARNKLNKNPRIASNLSFKLNINDILQKVHYESKNSNIAGYSIAMKLDGFKSQPNKNRTYRMIIKYIQDLLDGFCSTGAIFKYHINYFYDETETFCKKHEFDYDINDVLHYEFGINDIGNDVQVEIIIHLEDEKYYIVESKV